MISELAQVSVVAPIQPAIEHVKRLLFRPFDLGRWFTIGFCAWLAGLAQGGYAGFNTRFPFPGRAQSSNSSSGPGRFHTWDQIKDEVMRNLDWLLPLAIVLICLAFVVGLLAVWLSSRGDFMFLHDVARDRAEVAVPWRKYAREARSLFLFRLALALIAAAPILLLLATVVFAVVQFVQQKDWELAGSQLADMVVLGASLLALIAFGVAFVIVVKLTRDFVVPIMFLRGGTCREGWRELLGVLAGRLHLLIVYLLFQIVLSLTAGILVIVLVIATCCIAGCLLIIPYIGTVALLPVLVFQRAYSAYYLAQLGPRFDVFQTALPAGGPAPAVES